MSQDRQPQGTDLLTPKQGKASITRSFRDAPSPGTARFGGLDNDLSVPSLCLQLFVLRQSLPRRQPLLTHILPRSIFPLNHHVPRRRLIGPAWSRACSAGGGGGGGGVRANIPQAPWWGGVDLGTSKVPGVGGGEIDSRRRGKRALLQRWSMFFSDAARGLEMEWEGLLR